MTTTVCRFPDRVEFVTCEPTKGGFTNWRVTIGLNPLTLYDDGLPAKPQWRFDNLAALEWHLENQVKTENEFLKASYHEALAYVQYEMSAP